MTTDAGTTLPGSIWVRPAELANATGCRLLTEHRIDAVVLPRFNAVSAAPRLTRLDPDAARAGLLDNVEPSATKYDPFMADWFPDTATERRERLIDRLVHEVAFYRLEQDMARLSEATALVVRALAGQPVPVGSPAAETHPLGPGGVGR
jgi:hypothetical protein